MKKTRLDKEEQDILDSFERGEWKPMANRRQAIAVEDGMPYPSAPRSLMDSQIYFSGSSE